jgi:two-component system NarL family response regulator
MTVRVLLADDHRLLRELLREQLQKEPDIEVVGEASSGRELMEQLAARSPDLVVLDIAMPGLNGIDAMAELAARHPAVKVICLSGYSDRRYVRAMLKAGAAGYVVKSAAGTELLRAIRAVAAGQSYLCPEAAAAVVRDVRARGGASGGLGSLGKREMQVLQLLAEGNRSSSIAEKLSISVATVDTHRRNIMRKLDLHTVAELTKFAIREGLTLS